MGIILRYFLSPDVKTILLHSVTGDVDTGVVPVANVWYWFKIQVEDTGSRTEIRAKVWQEGAGEPVDWQVNVFDDSTTSRFTAGRIGLWSMSSGSKYWDDLAAGGLALP